MDRKLEFLYPTMIDAYSGVAGNISVQLNFNGYIPLIIANHFFITYYVDSKCAGYNWRFYNDSFGHFLGMHDLVSLKGIINALIYVIDQGYYVHIVIDHYYIKLADVYKKRHKYHDCATIFGYNTDKHIFYVADNFRNGKFEIAEISYEEIIEARDNCKDKTIEKFYFNYNIYYNLTLIKIKSLILGYINGTYYDYNEDNSMFEEIEKDPNEVYGILTFDILYKQILDTINKDNKYNVKSFHVMYNHMNVGVLLMQWLINNNTALREIVKKKQYLESYQELSKKMIIVRNLYIKLLTSFTNKTYEKLLHLINEIKEEESCLLKDFYDELEYICLTV